MPAARDDLSHRTLGEALEAILPEYCDIGNSDNSNIGETASVSAAAARASGESQTQVIPPLPQSDQNSKSFFRPGQTKQS